MIDTFKSYLHKNDKYIINISNNSIYIYNYTRINKLTSKEVEVELEKRLVSIEGENLKVSKMIKGEILISGVLTNLKCQSYE